MLDLKSEGGKTILRRLIGTADVLIENFGPGVVDRLGFGYEDLRGQYPSLIYCSLSGLAAPVLTGTAAASTLSPRR